MEDATTYRARRAGACARGAARIPMLEGLQRRGFDSSALSSGWTGVSVGCSQCEALVINGLASHELGCPNRVAPRDCFVCGSAIPDDCNGGCE